MKSTGLVLAAGGIAAANEILFAPVPHDSAGKIASDAFMSRFNWRILPATAVLALTLGGLEKAAPQFAVGLAGLVVMAVLIIPSGNAPPPIDNIVSTLGY